MNAGRSAAACPCDSGLDATRCCLPAIDGSTPADTAESLMRSRYVAFVTRNAPYLLSTWHPDTRPDSITFEPGQEWLGLKIRHALGGCPADRRGEVEFVARYKIGGKGHRLHERSRFEKVGDRWLYVDGIHDPG